LGPEGKYEGVILGRNVLPFRRKKRHLPAEKGDKAGRRKGKEYFIESRAKKVVGRRRKAILRVSAGLK